MDNTKSISAVLARWAEPEGHPYKGSLIDWDQYGGNGDEPPSDVGCMCAGGQILHLMGGWTPRQIKDIDQDRADAKIADLLDISITHAILLRQINDTVDGAPGIVLTNPESILGPNASGVLAMWLHFDAMTAEQWQAASAARAAWAASAARAAWDASAAWDAWDARDARAARAAWAAWAASAARAAWDASAAWDAWDARDARAAAYCAVAEMAGIKWMPDHEAGNFVFLPMFGFASPAEVLAAYPTAERRP